MITKLRLKNWKSHLDSEFKFSPGVNALIGIMGSGKTSVVQAISFALFGDFPALNKLKLNDLIMRKPQRKSFTETEICFQANGKDYTAKRIIEYNKGTTSAEIRENGKLIAVDSKQVTETVERMLEMDYGLFCRAVFSEQNALDYFLNLPRGRRTEHIDGMLQLDRFEAVRNTATALKNRLFAGIADRVKLLLEVEKENLPEKLSKVRDEVKEMAKTAARLGKELSSLLAEKSSVEESISAYDEMQSGLQDRKDTLTGLNAGTEELKKTIEKRRAETKGYNTETLDAEINEQGFRIKAMQNELAGDEKLLEDRTGEISSARAKKKVLEEEMVRLAKIISDIDIYKKEAETIGPDIEKRLETEKKKYEKIMDEHRKKEAGLSELRESISGLEAADARCPVCESLIESGRKEKLLKEKKKKSAQLEKEADRLSAEIMAGRKIILELEDSAKRYIFLAEKIEANRGAEKDMVETKKQISALEDGAEKMVLDAEKAKKEYREKEKELKDMEIKNEKLCLILNAIESIRELEARKSGYEEKSALLAAEIYKIESELKKIGIEKLRAGLKQLILSEGEIKAKRVGLLERATEKEMEMEGLAKRQETIEKERQKIGQDKGAAESLEKFCSALKATQIQLREEFLKTVNTAMAEMWGKIYPYGDFSGIRLSINEQYGDYVLELNGSDGWVSADAGVSGGERSTACLCLRIAFSIAFIPNLKWIILDEPTHNLDSNAIRQLAEVLRDKIGDIVEQMFLITHEEGLSEGITGDVYRLERDKEADGVTKVLENRRSC